MFALLWSILGFICCCGFVGICGIAVVVIWKNLAKRL